jgi:hypothetical protein
MLLLLLLLVTMAEQQALDMDTACSIHSPQPQGQQPSQACISSGGGGGYCSRWLLQQVDRQLGGTFGLVINLATQKCKIQQQRTQSYSHKGMLLTMLV